MRVIFMGTPGFSVPALTSIAHAHDVVAVYCQPPRPAGRGHTVRFTPVHAAAQEMGITVYHPSHLKDQGVQEELSAIQADVAVVAAYGLILPESILSAPRLGCLNIHASLLPRWRGAAPINRAIMAGDRETGITIMQMDAGLDTGPMLLSQSVRIDDTTTAGNLHDHLATLGATLIGETLRKLERGALKPLPQVEEGATYATRLSKQETHITWTNPYQIVSRHINGLAPSPGAWFAHAGTRVKVLLSEPIQISHHAFPGTVLDKDLTIACTGGAVRLLKLQREGRKEMDAKTFMLGFPVEVGTQLCAEHIPH